MTWVTTRSLAHAERLALCDLLDELGPEAPTLCEGWDTQDLAAHLVSRDRRLDSIPGTVLPPFSSWSERVRRGEMERPYSELVELVRTGPPRWSPMAVPAFDRLGNTHEFFIHHEDVRRARPGWQPRPLSDEDQAALWEAVGRFGWSTMRNARAGVVLCRPDGATRRLSHRSPSVTLTGPPGELLLFAFGRRDQALVELDGPPEAVAALRGHS